MIFSANESLENFIRKKTRESKLGGIGSVFIFIFISLAFYYNVSNRVLVVINILILGVFICFLIRSIVIVEGNNLNSIIKSLEISDEISIITYKYHFLFFKIPPNRITISKSEFNLIKVDFPYNDKGLENNQSYLLSVNEQKLYLLYKLFPLELEQEVGEII